MAKSIGLIHNANKGAFQKTQIGGSAPQNTAVGSGSRPTKSKIPIESSAPENPHTLGRDVPGSLK